MRVPVLRMERRAGREASKITDDRNSPHGGGRLLRWMGGSAGLTHPGEATVGEVMDTQRVGPEWPAAAPGVAAAAFGSARQVMPGVGVQD